MDRGVLGYWCQLLSSERFINQQIIFSWLSVISQDKFSTYFSLSLTLTDSALTATSLRMIFLSWDFEKWSCYFRFWLTPARCWCPQLFIILAGSVSGARSRLAWGQCLSRIPVKLGSFHSFLGQSEAYHWLSGQSEASTSQWVNRRVFPQLTLSWPKQMKLGKWQ